MWLLTSFDTGIKRGSNFPDDVVGVRERMFPQAKHTPTCSSEQRANESISVFVASNLWIPKSGSGLGHSAVPSATMPETTINKDGQMLTSKNKVRTAWKKLVATPTRNAGGSEDGNQLHFSGLVSF
jgi:hypothetical protein